MPIEEQLPPTLLEQICDYCRQMNLPLLVACDSNAHHPFWGCADFNNRGKALSEYLATSGLEVANVGNEPTFCTCNARSIIDLTLVSRPYFMTYFSGMFQRMIRCPITE